MRLTRTLAAVALSVATLIGPATAHAAPPQVPGPLPGEVTTNLEVARTINGRLALTNPRATYIADDSTYGPVLRITYDVANRSDAVVRVLGPASDAHSNLYLDADGSEMLVNCAWPFPYRPRESATCTMYRRVTRGELAAGTTFGDRPQFFPLYANAHGRTRILLEAEPVGLIPLTAHRCTPARCTHAV